MATWNKDSKTLSNDGLSLSVDSAGFVAKFLPGGGKSMYVGGGEEDIAAVEDFAYAILETLCGIKRPTLHASDLRAGQTVSFEFEGNTYSGEVTYADHDLERSIVSIDDRDSEWSQSHTMWLTKDTEVERL